MSIEQTIHIQPRNAATVTETPLNGLRAAQASRNLGWLNIAHETRDLDLIETAAAPFAQCTHLVLCGTGGSALGAQALYVSFRPAFGLNDGTHPRLHVLDTTEPFLMHAALHELPAEKTGWLFISKSGGTMETLTQFIAFLSAFPRGKRPVAAVITEPGDRLLRTMALAEGLPVYDHPTDIGGRFSVLSIVGMLPSRVLGLDIRALRQGAKDMAGEAGFTLANEAAHWHAANIESGHTSQILMPYAARLAGWTAWYRQLWAESLGKEGKGSTPLPAIGPVDQHSVMQLFLDGPRDKCLTLVSVTQHAGKPEILRAEGAPDYMNGRTGLDLLRAHEHGTRQTFIEHNIPLRELVVKDTGAHSLGELMMLGMLETAATAQMLGVNAYDQPAVEGGKKLAVAYLKRMSV